MLPRRITWPSATVGAVWLLLTAPTLCTAQIAVVNDLVMERLARPGEIYHGVLLVKNTTDVEQEVKVYQTDYEFFADGRSFFEEPGAVERSNANWMEFSPSYLRIPPRQTVPVSYTVTLPADSVHPLVGTYWSMLMVEPIAAGSPESTLPAEEGKIHMGIRATVRYGTQVVTHIEESGRHRVEFTQPVVGVQESGGRTLAVDLANTGERAFRPEVWVEVYDTGGAPVGRFQGKQSLVFPGSSVRQKFELGALAPGTYKVLLVADTGGDEIFGAQYTLRL